MCPPRCKSCLTVIMLGDQCERCRTTPVHRFGLKLYPADFDDLQRRLDEVTAAERRAWVA